jgi:hypothetical protein
VRIDRFAVPAEDDGAFLAEWDAVATGGPRMLLRAVRADAPVRFVELAASGAGEPYELVREAGDPDGEGGVVLLARYRPNPSTTKTSDVFVVAGTEPSDESDRVATKTSDAFVAAWDGLRAVLAGRRGHIGARLYRGAEDLVEVAHWSSPLMLQRAAQDPAVQAAGAAVLPALLDSAVYQVVRR